jgi:hypothetical protein
LDTVEPVSFVGQGFRWLIDTKTEPQRLRILIAFCHHAVLVSGRLAYVNRGRVASLSLGRAAGIPASFGFFILRIAHAFFAATKADIRHRLRCKRAGVRHAESCVKQQGPSFMMVIIAGFMLSSSTS